MKRLFISAIIVLFHTSVYADSFYKLVGYECDKKSDAIVISYQVAYNEAGEYMINSKRSQQWNPWSFVSTMKDDDHIGSLEIIEGECSLTDGTYTITIGPSPGNYNLQGRCGAFMSAGTEVRRGSKILLPHHEFEADCHNTEKPVTTDITIKAGYTIPIIKTMPFNEFYK